MCCESQQLIASLQKPPEASFQGWQGFIGLISVSGAAAEDSTTADAVGWAPGKTVAIAERSALSTDFPYGQSGTGRLSFRLRLAPPKRQTSGTSITRSARPNARKDCAPCRQAATPADFPNGQSGIRQPSLARSKTCQSPPHGYPQQVASPPLHTNPNPSSVALPPRERSCAHAAAHISEHKKLKTAGHILRSSRAELVAAHKQPATCEQFHHFPPSQKTQNFSLTFSHFLLLIYRSPSEKLRQSPRPAIAKPRQKASHNTTENDKNRNRNRTHTYRPTGKAARHSTTLHQSVRQHRRSRRHSPGSPHRTLASP